MAEKKPSVHKTIFLLILVIGPIYWLMLTDEGKRISDTTLMWLLGEDEIHFNVRELNSAFTRDEIKKVFSEIEWQCSTQETPFGNNLCAAQIGSFNGYPSRILGLYFRDDQISAFKLTYRDRYHEQLMGYFIRQLGQPTNVAAAVSEGPDASSVLEWDLGHGMLLMKKELGKTDEPSVVWLAGGPPHPLRPL